MSAFSVRCSHILGSLLVALTLASCGGGGGGSAPVTNPPPPPPPPPPPSSISGVVILGPVADADVELRGTTGLLGSDTTDGAGQFGPITYSGSYSGPLRITVSGNAGSTWTCDYRLGCFVNGNVFNFGQAIEFDGTLEAVLPSADDGQVVSVSLLSNFVAERMDIIGGLTAANVNTANLEIGDAILQILEETFTRFSMVVSPEWAEYELFDLHNLPDPGGDTDQLSILLSLLNSSLVGLTDPAQTTGEFIDFLSNQVATQPVLPISRPEFFDASQESFLEIYLLQLSDLLGVQDATTIGANALLSPISLNDLLQAAFDTLNVLPGISLEVGNISVFFQDDDLRNDIFQLVQVATTTGAQLQLADFGVETATFAGGDWFTAEAVLDGGLPHVRVEFDNAVIATLPNGAYEGIVEVHSTQGDFTRDGILVDLQVNIAGFQVFAGPDVAEFERGSVDMDGGTSSPGEVVAINWVQTGGPDVTVTGGDTFSPTIDLPAVASNQIASLRLDVDFNGGITRSDFIDINVLAYPNIADLALADNTLAQCVDDSATAANYTDVGEFTVLDCTGAGDVTGLEVFTNLTTLSLPDNSLTSLQPVIGLTDLTFLDITGNDALPCGEIDALADRLEEGVALLVADICLGNVALDLGANSFDAALDTARNQAYVSIPDRNEIAVVSLTDLRIVDRLLLPGRPYGIDLSIDGTRVFAALNGSNAVAVVDIDQRSVDTIDLGDSTGHSLTYDVAEGEPDRLFVTAAPGSSGFAYVAQILLDQGNAGSRVAGNRIIRGSPVLARSPDQQFVYVGEGFSPNSLYKLSLLDPTAPIVLEDNHGSVFGTSSLTLNLASTRIATGGGQVLRTGSFIEEGRVTGGRSVGSSLDDTLFVAAANGVVESWDFTTLAMKGAVNTGCGNGGTAHILAYDGDQSFTLVFEDTACVFTQISRTEPVDPFAALRFPDLALEECVVETAIAQGYTMPEEFTALDCSATPKTILSLDGIERMTSLQSLDISNSGVFELSPLTAMDTLQTLAVADANLSDIDPLFAMVGLASADLRGNAGIACVDLDQLTADGIALQADECTSTVRIELGGIGHDLAYDAAGDRAFVSIPSLNRISEIDLGAGVIDQNFALSGQPRGVDLSSDGQTVYTVLNDLGDLTVLDTTNGNTEDIDISVELDDDRAWDVAEVSPNRIVASTNPGSNGFGYIVEVRRDLGNAATRVASNRIIRARPVITVSPDQSAVYVGAGFSPNSLYKLDATQASLPIVLEDDHGQVSGTSSLALSPDGTRIYLESGQVLDTSTFNQVALFSQGRSIVSNDGTKLLIADTTSDSARVYDISTSGQVENRQWGCDLLSISTLVEYQNGVLALGDDLVCYSRTTTYP